MKTNGISDNMKVITYSLICGQIQLVEKMKYLDLSLESYKTRCLPYYHVIRLFYHLFLLKLASSQLGKVPSIVTRSFSIKSYRRIIKQMILYRFSQLLSSGIGSWSLIAAKVGKSKKKKGCVWVCVCVQNLRVAPTCIVLLYV